MSRIGKCVRNTSETQIEISINLDGSGISNIHTGIGFFDHMLISFAKHGFFDLDVKVNGDLYVDCHHTRYRYHSWHGYKRSFGRQEIN